MGFVAHLLQARRAVQRRSLSIATASYA